MREFNPMRFAAGVCAALALAACSSFEMPSKKVDYKSAGKIAPLEMPPDLTRPTADDRYVVPDVSPKGTATYSAYNKDRAGQVESVAREVLPQSNEARIERVRSAGWW
jgi:outer membrane protein assembly factor BamC